MIGLARQARDPVKRSRRRSLGLATCCSAFLLLPAGARASLDGMAPGLAEIVGVVEITGLSASPDGRKIAFRTEEARLDLNTHLLEWHVADLAGGPAVMVGSGGVPIYGDPGTIAAEVPVWSPDSNALFFRALLDDAIGLWRAGLDGAGARLVFRDDADIEALAREGTRIRMTLGPSRDAVRAAERQEYLDGILVDASVPLNQNVYRSGFVNGRLASQRLKGQWFTRVGLLSAAPRRLRDLDVATLEVGPEAAAPPPPALFELGVDPGVTALSESGATARAVQTNGRSIVEVTRPDGSLARCASPLCSERIAALVWRPGTDQLLLTVQDAHLRQSLHLWEPATGGVRQVASAEGYLGGRRDGQAPCAVTRSAAFCVTASAVEPPRLEQIDLETGIGSVLFDPNRTLRRRTMPSVERLEWSTPEGQSFTGILLLPPGGTEERLPLFLNYYHCSGFLSGGVGDELPFLALAASGMAVACVNLPPPRGVEDFLGRYDEGLAAVKSLVAKLDRRALIDPERVGMAGLSFGSEVTMWTLMNSKLIAAAAIASSQIEPTYYWFNSVRGRTQPEVLRRFWELGAPDETPEAWRQTSAALNVHRISAPLLMQLPEQEARNVVELYARLSRSTTPTELYVFPDAAHLKLQPRHRLAAHQRYLDWFRFWLQGHEDPGSDKDQYRRWQALKERWRAAPQRQERSQSSAERSSKRRK